MFVFIIKWELKMGKNNRHGKAAIFSDKQYQKLRAATLEPQWLLFWDICWHTGERAGAVRLLRVGDVFAVDGGPQDQITFRARTRKRDKQGRSFTRQVPVNSSLKAILERYPAPDEGFLFPGSRPGEPIGFSAVDKMLRACLGRAGLGGLGFSSHSFRRSFITRLAARGTSVPVIQKITGHRDVRSLLGYVEVSDDVVCNALELIA